MPVKTKWNHKLKATVTIEATGDKGQVIGRAHYLDSNPTYLVRFVDQTGSFQELWIAESALAEKSTADDDGSNEEE